MPALRATDQPSRPADRRGWLLLLLTIATGMDAVNSALPSLASPYIWGDIHATPDEAAWIGAAYVAAKLTGLPLAAWLTLARGPAPLLAVASLAILVTSALCVLWPGLELMVACRAVQGFAGALLLVAAQTLLFRLYAAGRQPLVQALFAFGTIMAPTTLSPALTGWLIDMLSWEWAYLVNLPLAAAGIIAARLAAGAVAGAGPTRVDGGGLVLLGGAMLCLTFVLQEGTRHDWFEDRTIVWLTVAGLIALLLFAGRQLHPHASNALLDRRPFADEHFAFAFVVSFVAGCALFGSGFLVPGYAARALAFPARDTGLLLLPSGLTVGAGLVAAAALFQFRGVLPFKLIPIGVVTLMIGMAMLSRTSTSAGFADLMPGLALRGFGLGILFISLTMVAFSHLRDAALVHGIALFNFGRQMGGQLGVAWLATCLHHEDALHRAVLAEHLSAGAAALQERLDFLATVVLARGHGLAPEAGALALLQRSVEREIAALSYGDAFIAVALLFVFAAPALILVRLLIHRALSRARPDHAPGATSPSPAANPG